MGLQCFCIQCYKSPIYINVKILILRCAYYLMFIMLIIPWICLPQAVSHMLIKLQNQWHETLNHPWRFEYWLNHHDSYILFKMKKNSTTNAISQHGIPLHLIHKLLYTISPTYITKLLVFNWMFRIFQYFDHVLQLKYNYNWTGCIWLKNC